ncbi:MAG: tRNA epoxyqueuosine(34) reductase QueG [Deltaproteobacteria bacterium CG_4_10_14_0_2_um_filter_43_8]|nr:MAG: tRNA epoxyqueuosine(34) reductase QueG [Deltaproteobacteria bacterium CG11_big_fil_rev_8_21_14_0_20_42_23]PJA18201.1 MAG: tRNA epoxyqueuosine(34) reductase QueG [Deltaproteobacteria bacterium CG_4_10_14_0_2_um_filter_43_8]PJC63487.1 MAG: tRNA epoxyqueuosine(34) reductase QueG [Deltaproteobacteria bacterium CG_4_9_14_0_2_um_filter_42_21]
MQKAKLREEAKQFGFDLLCVAPAKQFKEHLTLKSWIDKGFHGSMTWLEKNVEKRLDPLKVMPEAKSVIVCATNYNTAKPYSTEHSPLANEDRVWISRYAWGDDYHEVLKKRFLAFCEQLHQQFPDDIFRAYTDTGPLTERVFAQHSGLGWVGKNTCIIHPKLGSFLFLTAIITSLELEPDEVMSDHCGKCTRCIDACPTQALKPYELDARKCISYLTIEHKDKIDAELEEKMGKHLFGCDICQDVCPWNQKSQRTEDVHFQAREHFFAPTLKEFKHLVETQYPQAFKNSPLKRAKKEGLLKSLARIEKLKKEK